MSGPPYYTWEFRTLVEVGSGCCSFAPDRFKRMGSQRIVMFTDKGLVDAGVADKVKEAFEAKKTPLVGVYDKIEQDASSENINECARYYRDLSADGLLAVGGGSVMDVVKSVKVLIGQDVTDVKSIMAGNMGYFMRPMAKPFGVPHISIPTTAGTGAEVSPGAVVYNEVDKIKGFLSHPYMNSDYALLDPDLTVGLPPKLTAETGFDALCHCVEAFFSPISNSMTEALALQGCRLIYQHLPIAVRNGKDLEARTEMLAASCMGIMAFVMTMVGGAPVHNIAHAAGGMLRIPHGEANAVLIPAVMKNFPSFYKPKAKSFTRAMGMRIDDMSDLEILTSVISGITALQEECNIKSVFPVEIDSDVLQKLHDAVKKDPAGMLYPLPDEVIDACLKDTFTVK